MSTTATHVKHQLITSGLFFRIVCECTDEVACFACKKLCRLVDELEKRHLIRSPPDLKQQRELEQNDEMT